MAQTASSLSAVLYDRWTDDELQKQWIPADSILSRVDGLRATMIGQQAQTPVWGDLNSGGYTTTGAAGGALNAASNQGTNQAVWTLVQQFFPIALEFSAMNQSDDGTLSLISGKNLEVRGALATLRKQAERQLVTNADAIVAQCDTGGASTTVELLASPSGTAYGYDAIVRGWLRPGAVVDIGTTADTDALVTGTTVTAVKEDAADPDITIGSSISTTSGTHFVYIANPNSASAANPELNGIRNIAATSGALGGLNPATAGQEFWAAASRDTSTTVLSLDLMLNLSRAVKQKTDESVSDVWMGLKQGMNFYALLQNQVRYAGDLKLGAGNVDEVAWAGQKVAQFSSVLDSDVHCLIANRLRRITGRYEKPTWLTKVYGGTELLQWRAGNTDGQDALAWAFQLGTTQRNAFASATALTA